MAPGTFFTRAPPLVCVAGAHVLNGELVVEPLHGCDTQPSTQDTADYCTSGVASG